MVKKHRSCDAGNSHMPKRSYKVLPLSEVAKISEIMNLLSMILWRRKNKFVLVLLSHLELQTRQPQCVISAWIGWERHYFVMEDLNRKHVLIDCRVLCQKTLSPYNDFSKGSADTSDTKPFTARKSCCLQCTAASVQFHTSCDVPIKSPALWPVFHIYHFAPPYPSSFAFVRVFIKISDTGFIRILFFKHVFSLQPVLMPIKERTFTFSLIQDFCTYQVLKILKIWLRA